MEHALTAMEQEDVPCVQAEENGKITTEYIMIAVYVMAEDNAQVVMAGKHSIFRHDNFIGCFSADKIKMSARK